MYPTLLINAENLHAVIPSIRNNYLTEMVNFDSGRPVTFPRVGALAFESRTVFLVIANLDTPEIDQTPHHRLQPWNRPAFLHARGSKYAGPFSHQ